MLTILRPEICACCLEPLRYGVAYPNEPSSLTAFCTNQDCAYYNREFHWPAVEVHAAETAALLRKRVAN